MRAGRRQCSSSGSWAWALAARPCVTGQAVPTAARPAERTVGVGSTGSPSGTPVEARRGGAGRRGSGAGSSVGDCGALRQRGGEEGVRSQRRGPARASWGRGWAARSAATEAGKSKGWGACKNPNRGRRGPSREFTSYSPSRSRWFGSGGGGRARCGWRQTEDCSLQMS